MWHPIPGRTKAGVRDGMPTAAEEPQHRPWYRSVRWDASFWVVLLAMPFVMVATSPLGIGVRVLVCSAILGFAALYVWTVSTMPEWQTREAGLPLTEQLRPVALPLVGLLLLDALTVPVMTWWAAYFLPYFAGILLFALTLTAGLAIVVIMCAAAVISAFVLQAPIDALWMSVGCCASCIAVAAGRVGAEVSERRRIAEKELVAAGEREEISRDVHDILGHSLTVLTLKAEVAHRLVRDDPARAEAELAEIVELSRSALADVRATVTRLRTPDLAGQVEATRTAMRSAAIDVEVDGRARDVPLPQRELLSWALREATTNILRHAAATHVRVEIGPGLLRVTDDGVGTAGAEKGNGLHGLEERVRAAGGSLRLRYPTPAGSPDPGAGSGAGPGTQLEVVL